MKYAIIAIVLASIMCCQHLGAKADALVVSHQNQTERVIDEMSR